jgi:hypothetical protein
VQQKEEQEKDDDTYEEANDVVESDDDDDDEGGREWGVFSRIPMLWGQQLARNARGYVGADVARGESENDEDRSLFIRARNAEGDKRHRSQRVFTTTSIGDRHDRTSSETECV